MGWREPKNGIAERAMFILTALAGAIIIIIAAVLFFKALPILTSKPTGELLFSPIWQPWGGQFGFYAFILGTLWVTALAMLIAVPVSILTAVYLAEYAPARVRGIIKPAIDLLAAIPSVVYGLWGVLVVVPFIRDVIAPIAGIETTGYTILAGGIVLAIMVFPVIISVSTEVIASVPRELREASRALGATKWETVKYVTVRSIFPGIFAAIILGFGRAIGETMAVLMVVGNVAKVPSGIFDPAYPLPALIANNYGEMMSIPMYDSALLLAALMLLAGVVIFSAVAEITLMRFGGGMHARG
ncbi:MAG: phosphate ABC transporter permease subunit PstC [Candidatus Diapherotrites archaeon]